MTKSFFIMFLVLEVSGHCKGQAIDTVITINNGKTPAVYSSNKLYYEKNYDTLKRLVFEGLKFNSCYLGTIKYYWSSGKLMSTRKYLIDKPDSSDLKRWSWMKNYLVWEANRKVFVYPENWIEPDLQHDKTPYFKKLETELRCNIPDGEWNSYDKEGKLISTVYYQKGKRVIRN